jgi:hypothetical protein
MGFLCESQKQGDHLEELYICGRILNWILRERERGWDGMDWIDLAHVKDQ